MFLTFLLSGKRTGRTLFLSRKSAGPHSNRVPKSHGTLTIWSTAVNLSRSMLWKFKRSGWRGEVRKKRRKDGGNGRMTSRK